MFGEMGCENLKKDGMGPDFGRKVNESVFPNGPMGLLLTMVLNNFSVILLVG